MARPEADRRARGEKPAFLNVKNLTDSGLAVMPEILEMLDLVNALPGDALAEARVEMRGAIAALKRMYLDSSC